jgi:DNA-binding NarL/FixJ family response regulator
MSDVPHLGSSARHLQNTKGPVVQADDTASIGVVVIERRALVRECLVRCLASALNCPVVAFPTVGTWIESKSTAASIVLLSTAANLKDPDTDREVDLLLRACDRVPVILVSDAEEDPARIADALQKGTRAYIPASVSLDVAIEALRLVWAGGSFVPASCFMAVSKSINCDANKPARDRMFTERQAAVVDALRQGKANKIIAYKLNMRESTVKVHVRNIMKKLRARNRTEVAFMASNMEQDESSNSATS